MRTDRGEGRKRNAGMKKGEDRKDCRNVDMGERHRKGVKKWRYGRRDSNTKKDEECISRRDGGRGNAGRKGSKV